MIKQCKGKDLNKVPVSKLDTKGKWLCSIKYDGHYCQIHKRGNTTMVYTSGGKEIRLADLEDKLNLEFGYNTDIILEAEFIGLSEGKLGDRTKCGMLTTWRMLTARGLPCYLQDNKFVIFNELTSLLNNIVVSVGDRMYLDRYSTISNFIIPEFKWLTLDSAKSLARKYRELGWEGIYAVNESFIYKPGKRVNEAVKIKKRPTADLVCTGVLDGTGKYEGMVGSLRLIDYAGRTVDVGSGLSDIDRLRSKDYYIGKTIEIEYEQILDTYIQPTYISIKEDL